MGIYFMGHIREYDEELWVWLPKLSRWWSVPLLADRKIGYPPILDSLGSFQLVVSEIWKPQNNIITDHDCSHFQENWALDILHCLRIRMEGLALCETPLLPMRRHCDGSLSCSIGNMYVIWLSLKVTHTGKKESKFHTWFKDVVEGEIHSTKFRWKFPIVPVDSANKTKSNGHVWVLVKIVVQMNPPHWSMLAILVFNRLNHPFLRVAVAHSHVFTNPASSPHLDQSQRIRRVGLCRSVHGLLLTQCSKRLWTNCYRRFY